MSLATNVANLATRIATEIKTVRASIGTLGLLTTTSKASIVAAINELHGAVQSAAESGGASINDTAPSSSTSYSGTKVEALVSAATAALVDGAPGTLDTLNELAAALGDDANAVTSLTEALGNRVRYDAAQTLTALQQTQARSNIGAASAADVGDTTTNFVTVFEAGLA